MIRKATPADVAAAAALAAQLWLGHTAAELEDELLAVIESPGGAVFLAEEGEESVAFAQCQLRHDYVEGTDSSPVGYLEGVYVAPAWRHRGVARALLSACENWVRSLGCTEFASDCELTNTDSLQFHLKNGFAEANRIICFTKKL